MQGRATGIRVCPSMSLLFFLFFLWSIPWEGSSLSSLRNKRLFSSWNTWCGGSEDVPINFRFDVIGLEDWSWSWFRYSEMGFIGDGDANDVQFTCLILWCSAGLHPDSWEYRSTILLVLSLSHSIPTRYEAIEWQFHWTTPFYMMRSSLNWSLDDSRGNLFLPTTFPMSHTVYGAFRPASSNVRQKRTFGWDSS